MATAVRDEAVVGGEDDLEHGRIDGIVAIVDGPRSRTRRGRARRASARSGGRRHRVATPGRAPCSRSTARRAPRSRRAASRDRRPRPRARCSAARVFDNRSSTRPAVTDRYSRTVVASVSRTPISSAIASVVCGQLDQRSASEPPDRRRRRPHPPDSRVIRCIAVDQRPPSSDTRPGSCSIRELIDPSVRAIASARSEARFAQNSASAARVGTDRAIVDLRERGRRRTAPACVPTTQTSLATHAVGQRGSSPGASTRPIRPASPIRRVRRGRRTSAARRPRRHGLRPSNSGVVANGGRSRSSCGSRSVDGRRGDGAAAGHERRQRRGPRPRRRRGRWRA